MSTDTVLDRIAFDAAGLVPAVAQQHDTGEVLMVAWMNRDAVAETLATGRVCYWSRSRGRLWRKGESSGQVQRLVEMRVDCDQDALWLLVEPAGPACHTGARFSANARGPTFASFDLKTEMPIFASISKASSSSIHWSTRSSVGTTTNVGAFTSAIACMPT